MEDSNAITMNANKNFELDLLIIVSRWLSEG